MNLISRFVFQLIVGLLSEDQSIWVPDVECQKLKSNLYCAEFKIYNLHNDTIYLEVPYPYSVNLEESVNYFNSMQYSKTAHKEFYTNAWMPDPQNLIIYTERDFIRIPPRAYCQFKFNLNCHRKYRQIVISFKYSYAEACFRPKVTNKYYDSNTHKFDIPLNVNEI